MEPSVQFVIPDQCRGKWVAMLGLKAIACAESPREALDEAERVEPGSHDKCFVTFVQREPQELIL